jgi:hypothetical protein
MRHSADRGVSGGVFAIAITFLMLEIKVPHPAPNTTSPDPSALLYLASPNTPGLRSLTRPPLSQGGVLR